MAAIGETWAFSFREGIGIIIMPTLLPLSLNCKCGKGSEGEEGREVRDAKRAEL